MEPWLNEIKNLYRSPGAYKEYLGAYSDGVLFDGANIVSGSVKITQSISDAEQLTYGTVEAAMLEARLAGGMNLATSESEILITADGMEFLMKFPEFKNVEITVTKKIGTKTVPIGVFIVDECKLEGDTWFREVVAYDRLIKFKVDVADWYNGLDFSNLTLKEFRESLCAFVGVPCESVALSNDAVLLEKTVEPSVLAGSDVLRAVCELNACWPQMTPEGVLRWVTLGAESCETLDYEVYEQVYRPESAREDFMSAGINAVVIRETEDDVGGHYPETMQDNPYIIQDNFLVYGKSSEALSAMAQSVLAVIGGKPYKPHTTIADGRPYLQCGDMITVRTQKETFVSYVLKRTLRGESSLVDTYEAQGTERVTQDYGINSQIIQLKGKTNALSRTVDQTLSRVEDVEVGFSEIEQYVEGITLSVENGDVSSTIQLKAGETIITSQEIKMTGLVTFNDLSGSGTTQINGANITTGTIAAARIDVDNLNVKKLVGATGTFNQITSTGSNPYIKFGSNLEITEGYLEIANIYLERNLVMIGDSEFTPSEIKINAGGVTRVRIDTAGLWLPGAQNSTRIYMNPPTGSGTAAHWVYRSGDGIYSLGIYSSSMKYKDDIRDLDIDAAGVLNLLKPSWFRYKQDDFSLIGLIAEPTYEACADLVALRDGEPDSIRYESVTTLLVAAVQELNRRVKEIENAR